MFVAVEISLAKIISCPLEVFKLLTMQTLHVLDCCLSPLPKSPHSNVSPVAP